MSETAELSQAASEAPDSDGLDDSDQRGALTRILTGRAFDLCIVVVLTIVAVAVRVGELAPSSVFLDDAWVSYVSKASYGDIGMMGLTAPGFLAVQKIWFDVVGFSELNAQFVPFVASALTPAAFYLTLRRLVRTELAVLAGLIAALTSLNVEYAYHVKQYTTEVFAGVLIFALTCWWLKAPSSRRLWATVAAIAAASAFSFLVVVLATGPLAVIALRSLRDGRQRILEALPPLLGLGAFLAGLYLLFIRANTSNTLETYWGAFYLETDGSVLDLVASLQDRTWGLFDSLTPYPSWIVAVICSIAFIAGLVRRFELTLMATIPLIAAAVLAGMHKAPLGGGRTDNYLLVPLLFGFIVGLDALIELAGDGIARFRERPDLALVGAVTAALFVGLTVASFETPAPYPAEDISPLIEELETLRRDDDVVLLYYASTYAYALYADVESEPIDAGTPYVVRIDDPGMVVQGSHRQDPSRYLQYAQEALARSDRVWLLGSHFCSCDWGEINRQLRDDLGLEQAYANEREGASLYLWTVPGSA